MASTTPASTTPASTMPASTAPASPPPVPPGTDPARGHVDWAAWRPGRRALWWVLLAFVGGLIAFAMVWNASRDDFFTPGPAGPTASTRDYAPLPTPLPAGSTDASGMGRLPEQPAAPTQQRPQLVEAPRPPPPPAKPAPAAPRTVASSQPTPIPGSTPAPRYPPQALRRGESGSVLVRVDIGTDGTPTSVGIVRTSGSRLLDRAAIDAVRRWRFRPATRDGQPVAGSVVVPIDFRPN